MLSVRRRTDGVKRQAAANFGARRASNGGEYFKQSENNAESVDCALGRFLPWGVFVVAAKLPA
jgi:hypothetical protein